MSDCLFCRIIRGEIPGKFVYRDEATVAFYDINPKAPVHVLIMPVKHFKSLQDVGKEDKDLLGQLMLTVREIAEKLGIAKDGYKIVSNNGRESGQLVFHLHIHLLGGWERVSGWQV